MATYPALKQSLSSSFKPLDDIQVDRASNGSPRIRALYTAPKYIGSIVHEGISATDKATLDAFYLANRLISFSFMWDGDGVTYTCYFSGPPDYKPTDGLRWQITVPMVQA